MGLRTDLKQKVETQLKQEIQKHILCANENIADCNTIYNELTQQGFIEITSPEEQKERQLMQMLTLSSLKNFNGGNSIKPGNIILNIKTLIDAIPSVIEMTVSIALDIPILKICAALNIWKTVKKIFNVDISKDEAFVIVALWKNCDNRHRILLENGYHATNVLYERYGEPTITEIKYQQIVDSLENLKCIELDNSEIWLREWISKKYIDSV